MKLYLRARDIPELATLPEPDFRVTYEACVTPVWRRDAWLGGLIAAIFASAGFSVGQLLNHDLLGWPSVIGAGLGGLAAVQCFEQIVYERSRPNIRKYLEALKNV